MSYRDFLKEKNRLVESETALQNVLIPDWLKEFQKDLVLWACRQARSAVFADCGLGKTPMQLVWGDNVVRHTNKPVLLATPLAVGYQTMQEAEKFGIDAERSRDGKISGDPRIVVTNYEQLDKFDADQFGGMIGDESSAIKSFKSQRKKVVTEFMKRLEYRSLWTATAAPNDYWELGTSSEALGYLGFRDMITTFFTQETTKDYLGWGRSNYRFRGHAEEPFWRWVSSWARAVRRPSDMGYDDGEYVLPELIEKEIIVNTEKIRDGLLFSMPGKTLNEQREERRNSIPERCSMASKLASDADGPSVIWCELNAEADMVERELKDGVQVSGSMPDERKEEILKAFADGDIRQLITKPKIGCWGLNWQHCRNVIVFPSHSFEQYYQAVRRCWRFGQTEPVKVSLIVNEGEAGVLKNIRRKADQANTMFESLTKHMNDALTLSSADQFLVTEEIPKWL